MNGSAPISYSRIEAAMLEAISKMETLTSDFAAFADELARAESNFKVGFAKERLKARMEGEYLGRKMTADMADDLATINSEKLRLEFEGVQAQHDACRQAILTVRAQLEGYRSLMASYREQGA